MLGCGSIGEKGQDQMALKIGDTIVGDPQLADIARAVDAAPQSANWRIELDNGEDDHIEAAASPSGDYAVTFVDRGRRFTATAPVDADRLKTILSKYHDGDTEWRDQADFVAEGGKGARERAARRISSKPPAWAIVLIAGAFFGLPILWRFLPESGAARGAAIVVGPITVMLVAMIVSKLLQLRRAASWPQAAGRITKSVVATRRARPFGRPMQVINFPAIEYEFSVNGRKCTGQRISIGEDAGGANIEATLARYPVGAQVTVHYDPADPENCVLERNAPSLVPLQGCGTSLTSLAAIGFCVYWAVGHYDGVIAPMWATGNGRVAICATVVGLLSLMAYFGSLIIAKQNERPWSSVNGTIVDSRTESDSQGRQTSYSPLIEYSYFVFEREYHGRAITTDDQGADTRAEAEKIAGRYRKGHPVIVYYDPLDPRDAMLERPPANRPNRIALAVGVASFIVAIYASGRFHF
jgi:Protein of unknown function (DUF3592)